MLRVTLLGVGCVVLLTACGGSPRSFVVATPQPIPDAYGCALAKVNQLGYTVTNTNKEAGFIAATKQTSGLGTRLLLGSEYHDQITVSIFEKPGSSERTIRVTAGRVDRQSDLFGTVPKGSGSVKPTEAGVSDARVVLKECGSGTIAEPLELGLSWSASA